MSNTMESLPEDGRFVIVEDLLCREAVARWSSKFGAWFGVDGDPIVLRPIIWRPMPTEGSPKSLPQEGQLVIVEDASGENAVARWSSEIEAWFGPDGNPIAIRPVNWRPMPREGSPPSPSDPRATSEASVPESNAAEAFQEDQFNLVEDTTGALQEPVDATEESIDGQPMPVGGLSTLSRVARRRRSFPIFPIALISIVSSAVLMTIVSGGDSATEFRALLAWLQKLWSNVGRRAPSCGAARKRARGCAASGASGRCGCSA